jgi:hypothetical protein
MDLLLVLIGMAKLVCVVLMCEVSGVNSRRPRNRAVEMPCRRDARPVELLQPPIPPQRPALHHAPNRYEAEQRGLELLLQNLSEFQREQYKWNDYFEVVGGTSGKRYRIRHGHTQNVDELDQNGEHVCSWCFAPAGGLVAGDVMLVQKLALELFEQETIAIANQYNVRSPGYRHIDPMPYHEEYYRMFHQQPPAR